MNEITTSLVSPENNQLSIQNNYCSLSNPMTSNEHCFLISSIHPQRDGTEHIDINLRRSINNYCESEKENISDCPASKSKSIIRCEKLISNLLSLKKANENIDILLTMFK